MQIRKYDTGGVTEVLSSDLQKNTVDSPLTFRSKLPFKEVKKLILSVRREQ
jgi:hypothetical protein